MKKLLWLLVVALSVFFTSCQKDDVKPEGRFVIDPNATISIKPAHNVNTAPNLLKAGDGHLSDLEIVKQCVAISFQNTSMPYGGIMCGFADILRDTLSNPPMLKRWAADLLTIGVDNKPHLIDDFINAEDIIFFKYIHTGKYDYRNIEIIVRDTIAYTPNSLIRSIEKGVYEALEKKDTASAYKIFNTWTFTPITGAEWRELKKNGMQ